MKKTTFIIIFLVSLYSFSVQAQDEKKSKNKSKSQPKLTVVELEKTAPVVEPQAAQRPANGSLFTDGAANGNLLGDFKARRVGDLVFINVIEESEANVTSSAKRSRDSGDLGGLGTLVGALPINGAATAGSVVEGLGKRKFEGKGQTERNSELSARIAARVVEVLPNGDMRIQAIKLLKINKETEQLALTGIVRQSDISADNSIPTILVGDLKIEFNGKGIASKDNAPGWLFRLFEKISPF